MSKNNWMKAVNEINRQRFTIPEGWDTREQVAEKLQCSPDRVSDLLKPGLSTGDFERQEFNVWDDTRRLTVKAVCYRVAVPKSEAPPAGKSKPVQADDAETDRVTRAILRNPRASDATIAKNNRSSSKRVREIRASM
jgi:hypothetical protein